MLNAFCINKILLKEEKNSRGKKNEEEKEGVTKYYADDIEFNLKIKKDSKLVRLHSHCSGWMKIYIESN